MSLLRSYVTFAGISLEDKADIPSLWTDMSGLHLGMFRSVSQGTSEALHQSLIMNGPEHWLSQFSAHYNVTRAHTWPHSAASWSWTSSHQQHAEKMVVAVVQNQESQVSHLHKEASAVLCAGSWQLVAGRSTFGTLSGAIAANKAELAKVQTAADFRKMHSVYSTICRQLAAGRREELLRYSVRRHSSEQG